MEFKIEGNNIFCLINNEVIGHVTMIEEDNDLTITQTYVNDNYRGQKIASKMMDVAIQYAIEKGLNIKATCSFAKKYLERNKNSV